MITEGFFSICKKSICQRDLRSKRTLQLHVLPHGTRLRIREYISANIRSTCRAKNLRVRRKKRREEVSAHQENPHLSMRKMRRRGAKSRRLKSGAYFHTLRALYYNKLRAYAHVYPYDYTNTPRIGVRTQGDIITAGL